MSEDDGTDGTFDLTRRRALAGLGTVGVASAATGAGTFALFSDTEASSDNTVQAGTLDLTADGNDGTATTTLTVPSNGNAAPGDTGRAATTLVNDGSLDGFLNFDVGVVTNDENTAIEPEREAGDTGAPGELGSVLDVRYGFDTTGDGSIDRPVVDTTDAPYETIDRTGGIEYNPNIPLPGSGGAVDFVVEWALPRDAGNVIQSDEVVFDVGFELLQEADGRDVVLTGDSLYSDAKGFGGTFGPTSSTARTGDGSWQSGSGAQSGLYFGGSFSGYHALPTFTVGDIAELGYWMNHSNSLGTDFFLQVFTAPKDDGTDLGGFFNARLTAVPPNANGGSPVWNPGQWNEFSTDPGAQNQLYFYLEDDQQVSTTPRTLADLKSNPFTANGNDYGQATDEVFAIAMITNSRDSGFTGYLDDVSLELTGGETLSIDLEP
jgi:predicted ribosomally synthesized peptide with SipW-like signal peptide